MSIPRTAKIDASTSLTSTLTRVQKVVITSKNAANATFQLSEVVAGATSLTIEVPPSSGLSELSWDPPLRFATGVSVSVPTSVGLNITYEPG